MVVAEKEVSGDAVEDNNRFWGMFDQSAKICLKQALQHLFTLRKRRSLRTGALVPARRDRSGVHEFFDKSHRSPINRDRKRYESDSKLQFAQAVQASKRRQWDLSPI